MNFSVSFILFLLSVNMIILSGCISTFVYIVSNVYDIKSVVYKAYSQREYPKQNNTGRYIMERNFCECGGGRQNYLLLAEYGNAPLFALIEMEIMIEMGIAL